MKIGTILRTFFSRFLLLLIVIVFFVPIMIFICIPARYRYDSKVVFWVVNLFYRAIFTFSLLPIKFVGAEHIPDEPVIFVANHQSSLDIPLVGALANKKSHIWLAKQELMQSPILRWILPIFTVLVDMSSPKKAVHSLRKIIALVDGKNRHVMIFPEGGRYTDGVVHEFFGGFVVLAKKTGRPVIPVCILGVDKVYPPDSFLVYWYPITVIVGKPFVYQEGDTDEAFKQRVYKWFLEQTGQSR